MNRLYSHLQHLVDRLNLGQRLMLITLGPMVLVFALSLSLYIVNAIHKMYAEENEQLRLIATVLSQNSTAAMAFQDQTAAADVLSALANKANVLEARLRLPDGREFSHYVRTPGAGAQASAPVQSMTMPVKQNEMVLGELEIVADLGPLAARQATLVLYALGIILGAAIAALWLSRRLQRIITSPLAMLGEAMDEVTRSKNFQRRIEVKFGAELGHLMQGYNTMMEELQTRDRALAQYQRTLEKQVEERTEALTRSNLELKFMVEELAGYRRSLEQQVEERTQALSASNAELKTMVEALEQAKTRAEQASRAKSQFLTNMSHELRTPMNGVLGMIEVLFTTPLNEYQTQYCSAIRRSGESLLSLISNILDLSKIEAGKLELAREPMDLVLLVEEVSEMFALPLNRKGINFVTNIAANVRHYYYGDPLRLRQILINLLGNAVKFTHCGSISVRLRRSDNGITGAHRLRFEIADTGIGISPEARAHIFDAFSQGDSSTTRQYGGTGLGLTISRDLVRLMGGDFEVESEPGRGTTFSFTVPLTPGEALPLMPHEQFQHARVLIVDPIEESRASLRNILSSWGLQTDAIAALDHNSLPSARDFDIALIDESMNSVAQRLKTLKGMAQIRCGLILLCSPESVPADYAALRLPISKLMKPLRRSALYNAVLQLVRGEVAVDSNGVGPAREQAYLPQFQASILLAEDTALNQEVAYTMLSLLGCKVHIVENGAEAIAALRQHAYDLVLMDCQMPVLDGFDATRQLRALARQRPLPLAAPLPPIIAVTAHAVSGDREHCLAAGMDDYLAKPFRQSDLIAVLRRWLSTAREPAQNQTDGAACAAASAYLDDSVYEEYRAMGDAAFHAFKQRIIAIYLRDAAAKMQELRAGLDGNDADKVWKAAHALKSCSAAIGAHQLAALCLEFEMQGKAHTLAGLHARRPDLEQHYTLTIAAISAQQTSLSAPASSPGRPSGEPGSTP